MFVFGFFLLSLVVALFSVSSLTPLHLWVLVGPFAAVSLLVVDYSLEVISNPLMQQNEKDVQWVYSSWFLPSGCRDWSYRLTNVFGTKRLFTWRPFFSDVDSVPAVSCFLFIASQFNHKCIVTITWLFFMMGVLVPFVGSWFPGYICIPPA